MKTVLSIVAEIIQTIMQVYGGYIIVLMVWYEICGKSLDYTSSTRILAYIISGVLAVVTNAARRK